MSDPQKNSDASDAPKQVEELAELCRSRTLMPPIQKLIRKYGYDPRATEELAQEVLVRMVKTVREGERIDNYWHLGVGIARNLIRTGTRHKARMKSLPEDEGIFAVGPEDSVEGDDAMHDVRLAALSLRHEQRLALNNTLYGVSLQEIAEDTGRSVATVHRRQNEALAEIRELLVNPQMLENRLGLDLRNTFCEDTRFWRGIGAMVGAPNHYDLLFWPISTRAVVIEVSWSDGMQYLTGMPRLRPFYSPDSEMALALRAATSAEIAHVR